MPSQKQNRREILEWGVAATAAIFAALLPSPVGAQPRPRGPIVLAVTDFMGATPGERETARKMAQVIASGLEHSGRFMLLDSSAVASIAIDTQAQPQLSAWIALKAQGLVTGRVAIQRQKLRSEVRLWDVAEGKQLMAKSYISAPQGWRPVAHNMADSIRRMLTGKGSHFED